MMQKPFLLIAGENYYPSSGTGDWVDRFTTKEEAEVAFQELKEKNAWYDWHTIVDLRIEDKNEPAQDIMSLEEIENAEKLFNKFIFPGNLDQAIRKLIDTAKSFYGRDKK